MFDEIKRYIEVSEEVMQQLIWTKNSAQETVDRLKNQDRDSYDDYQFNKAITTLEVIGSIEKFLMKKVKESL